MDNLFWNQDIFLQNNIVCVLYIMSVCLYNRAWVAGTTWGLGVAHATPLLFIDFVSLGVLMFYMCKSICMYYSFYYKNPNLKITHHFLYILICIYFCFCRTSEGVHKFIKICKFILLLFQNIMSNISNSAIKLSCSRRVQTRECKGKFCCCTVNGSKFDLQQARNCIGRSKKTCVVFSICLNHSNWNLLKFCVGVLYFATGVYRLFIISTTGQYLCIFCLVLCFFLGCEQ